MKKRKVLSFLFALAVGVSAWANGQDDSKDEWRKGWFVEFGAGTQVIFSSDANKLSFGKRITPLFSLSGGKWFNPVMGLRLQLQGYSLNGFSTVNGIFLRDPLDNGRVYGKNDPISKEVTVLPDGSYRHYLRYLSTHVDFRLSLFNLFDGVKDTRRFDLIPSVGLGYTRGFSYRGSANTHSLTTHVGLMAKYNVIKCLDVNMEVASAIMPDYFDGRITGKQYEPVWGATLGATYHFKSSNKASHRHKRVSHDTSVALPHFFPPKLQVIRDTVIVVREVERITEKDLEKVVEKAMEKVTRKLEAKETPEKEKIADSPKALEVKSFTLASVFFDIGKSTPKPGQEVIFLNVVKFLRENPRARIRLDGYADKDTGYDKLNLILSVERAGAVRELLRNEYGVDASRIEVQGIGANYQPYTDSSLNRTVLITAIVE